VAAGHFFRIVSVEGPQVGDLNLWNAHDLTERFYSGKTRALHATHLSMHSVPQKVGQRRGQNTPHWPARRPFRSIRDRLALLHGDDRASPMHASDDRIWQMLRLRPPGEG
jgi:uncharacterized protein